MKSAIDEKRKQERFEARRQKFAEYEKTKISLEEYAQGVRTLVDHVFGNPTTSGARICANVLLSCYRSDKFHLAVTDLCLLDMYLYPAALAVIRGRLERTKEPHYMIENGSEVFIRMWERYDYLTVANQAKRQCDCCNGMGKLYKTDEVYNQVRSETCRECDGRGWSWPDC